MPDADTPRIFHYTEIEWDRPLETAAPGTAPPAAMVAAAERSGARRKKLVRGDAGFFMNRSVLPAGFEIPPHSHDHGELIVVLRGALALADGSGRLDVDDAIVIEAGTAYGFVAGADGAEFLTIRTGEATVG